jgi:hypothetical protein
MPLDATTAARAGKEGERHGPADRQQLGRPHDQHADGPTGHAVCRVPLQRKRAVGKRGQADRGYRPTTSIGLELDELRALGRRSGPPP